MTHGESKARELDAWKRGYEAAEIVQPCGHRAANLLDIEDGGGCEVCDQIDTIKLGVRHIPQALGIVEHITRRTR